jgi:hypothetical protein
LPTQNTENNRIPEVHALIALSHAAPRHRWGNSAASGGESPQVVTSKEGMIGPDLGGCAARLKLVQDSGSMLRVLFWRYLPIGEQLIDSRKSLLHGLLWLGHTFDLSSRAELLPEQLHSRCYVVNVSAR